MKTLFKVAQWIFIVAVFAYCYSPTLIHFAVMCGLEDSTAETIAYVLGV